MAIKVDSIETIYQASFILGNDQIYSGFSARGTEINFSTDGRIAMGITSSCVKGFNLDWHSGYHFVAATAMLLLVSRALFTYLFLGFLSSIFG